MTPLDQVFIKAYGKKPQAKPGTAVPAEPQPHTQRRVDAAHVPAPAEGPHMVVEQSPPPVNTQPEPVDFRRVDAQHRPQGPHWAMTDGSATKAAAPPSSSENLAPVLSDAHSAATQADQQAAATENISQAAPASSPEPQPTPAPLRAAFEVDRFLWPELAQRLLMRASWLQAARELAAAASEGQQAFVITSRHRGEGRTTVALCLAMQLARKKLRVALVDADFHRPQLARQLKLLPACAWDEVLRGALPVTESWIESVEDGVTLLPLKDKSETTGLTGNPRLKEQLSLLRRVYDVVLIDAGSLEEFTDREVLALLGGTAHIDGALLVCDTRKGPAMGLEQTVKCLDPLGIGRVDVVENFVRS